jgi:hypothetical protein
MAKEEKKVLIPSKVPVLNKMIGRVTHACFSTIDEVIDDKIDNPKVGKFVKGVLTLCENMILDEFPQSNVIPAETVKRSELPAEILETSEVRSSSNSQTAAFADSGE